MSEKFDRESIISELKYEALDEPETGWLSDLARRDLVWEERDEIIAIGDDWFGSVDVGHLAGIVESIISKHTEELATRLEQAEQAVARVREGLPPFNRALEYAVPAEDIYRALDGDTRG